MQNLMQINFTEITSLLGTIQDSLGFIISL